MSDYRRFIAYLYEYPNNRKGGCCGFVSGLGKSEAKRS